LEESHDKITQSISGPRKTEISGLSFLALLKYLREVILQDDAVLLEIEDYKDHPIFQHPIFTSEDFKAYAKELKEKIASTPEPSSLLLLQAFPIVATSISRIETQSVIHSQELTKLNSSSAAIEAKLDALQTSSNRKDFQYKQQLSMIFTTIGQGIVSDALDRHSTSHDGRQSTDLIQIANVSQLANDNVGASSVPDCKNGLTSSVTFQMNRRISNVSDAWREYFHSSLDNNHINLPSIKELDNNIGSTWRGTKSSTEGKFYERRLPLWQSSEALIEIDNMPEEQAVTAIDGMCKNHCNGSLRNICDKLQQHLKNWKCQGSFLEFLVARGLAVK
jgi:hypothetical protein